MFTSDRPRAQPLLLWLAARTAQLGRALALRRNEKVDPVDAGGMRDEMERDLVSREIGCWRTW